MASVHCKCNCAPQPLRLASAGGMYWPSSALTCALLARVLAFAHELRILRISPRCGIANARMEAQTADRDAMDDCGPTDDAMPSEVTPSSSEQEAKPPAADAADG